MPIGESTPEITATYRVVLQTTRPTGRTLFVEYVTSYGEDLEQAEAMVQDLIDCAVGSTQFQVQEAYKLTSATAPITVTPEP